MKKWLILATLFSGALFAEPITFLKIYKLGVVGSGNNLPIDPSAYGDFMKNPIANLLIWDVGQTSIDAMRVSQDPFQIVERVFFKNGRMAHCTSNLPCRWPTNLDLSWEVGGNFPDAKKIGEYWFVDASQQFSTEFVNLMPRLTSAGFKWTLLSDTEEKKAVFSFSCEGVFWTGHLGSSKLTAKVCRFKIHESLISI